MSNRYNNISDYLSGIDTITVSGRRVGKTVAHEQFLDLFRKLNLKRVVTLKRTRDGR